MVPSTSNRSVRTFNATRNRETGEILRGLYGRNRRRQREALTSPLPFEKVLEVTGYLALRALTTPPATWAPLLGEAGRICFFSPPFQERGRRVGGRNRVPLGM